MGAMSKHRGVIDIERTAADVTTFQPGAAHAGPYVKGGIKVDHWGGVKPRPEDCARGQGLAGRVAAGAKVCAD